MELNLEQIKAAAMVATQGQWLHYCPDGAAVNPERAAFVHGPSYRNMDRSQGFKIEDAAHIAAANPATVLVLIERLERAERERDGYKRALLAAPQVPDGTVCKGSMALGSGCGLCERCRKEMEGTE